MHKSRLLVALLLFATILLPRTPVGAAPAAPTAPPPAAQPPPPRPDQGLRLAVITDTHWVAGSNNTASRETLRAVADLQPDLVVHTGDVTEMGNPREYSEYLTAAAALGRAETLYVSGNHDTRWLDAGKAHFRTQLGPTLQSLDRAGVHLVLLDSSIHAEAHGHLDRSTLDWLAADLKQVGPDRPVLIFLHHPVAYTPLPFADTDDEFLAVLAPYNVRGVFVGHGHLQMRWQRNGIPFFMTAAADAGGYKILDLDTAAGTMTVHDGTAGEPLRVVARLPLARPAEAPAPPQITGVAVAAGRLRVEVQTAGLPTGLQYLARIDAGPWQPLGPGADPGDLMGDISLAGLAPGRHRVMVWIAPTAAAPPGAALTAHQWVQRDVGPSWSAVRDFDLAAGTPDTAGTPGLPPTPLWRALLRGGIQGSPTLDPAGNVYAASLAGEVAAFDPRGQRLWQRVLPAPVVGAPALTTGGNLLVATTDGSLYALATRNGYLRWQANLGAPLVAEPLLAAGLAFVGDSDGVLHALDLATGRERWRYQAGAAIRSRATYAVGTVYLGAWDRSVHAVDAFTGAQRWVRELPGSAYFSPANQPPLYFRGRVYVTRSQPQGQAGLYALDARNGEVLWSARGGFGYSSPVLHGGQVVVADNRGTVAAFEPLSGQPLWSVATGLETFDGALSSLGGDLVLAALNGQVAAVRPPGGDLPVGTTSGSAAPKGAHAPTAPAPAAAVWHYATGRAYLYARPVPGADRLYVATMDGSLVALGAHPSPTPPLTYGSPGAQPAVEPAPTFSDTAGHWSAPVVGLGQWLGLAGGYPGGTFQPDAPLTRAQLAVLVARYLHLDSGAGGSAAATPPGAAAGFADIAGHWAQTAILALASQGLLSGVPGPDGRLLYEPDRPVRRSEAAVIISRLLQRTAPSPGFVSRLVDLEGHWGARAVQSLEEIGLVRGVSPATGGRSFLPHRPMTRAEAAALLVRVALSHPGHPGPD